MTTSRMQITTWSLLAQLLIAVPALAGWSNNLFENTPIDVAPESGVFVQTVSDGAGGRLVFWNQADLGGGPPKIWAQRIDREGNLAWGTRVAVFEGSSSYTEHAVTSDDQGGAYLVVGVYDGSVYQQWATRVDGDGSLPWGVNGVPVVTSPTGAEMREGAVATLDDGSAVISWRDGRNAVSTDQDIYAQRFTRNGTRMWGAAGTAVCTYPEAQGDPSLVGDGHGGAFVVWEDNRSARTEIYGQHLLSNGSPDWAGNGMLLAYVSGSSIYNPQVVTGGPVGGFLLGYRGTDGTTYQIQVMRYSEAPQYSWQVFAGEATSGSQGGLSMAPDGFGGAFVAWYDYRTNSYDGSEVYAQWVTQGGDLRWGTTGTMAGGADGNQNAPSIAADGDGGAFVAWRDFRGPNPQIYSQHFTSSGTRRWNYTGQPVSAANGNMSYPTVAADDRGGMVCVFSNSKFSGQFDVFAQRLGRFGYPGDAAPTLTAVTDIPLDQGGIVRLDWNKSYLDAWDPDIVDTYSVWRRYAGLAKAAIDPVELDDQAQTLADATGMSADLVTQQLQAGWSYVGDVVAQHFDQYSYEAPTYADSTSAGTATTEFKVLAVNGGSDYWESEVLGGYSTDDLAPGAPVALSAIRDQGDGVLHWSPADPIDPDLQIYNVYRSLTAGFTPGPRTLVGTTEQTDFVDPGLSNEVWHYRVAGKDVHGNVGDSSNEASVGIVTAIDGPVSRAFHVEGATPNPFNPSTAIRFVLPEAGEARVDILDLRGRLVRQLAHRRFDAGRQEVIFDGRDDGGRTLGSGVYLARVVARASRQTAKLMLVK